MTLAFKEWSYIVDALGKGMQSVILRKGGIAEEEGEFILRGNKFLLLPTLFHQASQMIKPDWVGKLDGDRYHNPEGLVHIEYFAEVAMQQQITDWSVLQRLDGQHAWSEEIVKERFERWEKKVSLIIVQVYRLSQPFSIEMLPDYGGCKSWININEDVDLKGTPIEYEKIKGTFF